MSERVVLLCGSCSAEREVSLNSAAAVKGALEQLGIEHIQVRLDSDQAPDWLEAQRDVVLPVLHGGFGENGELQKQLEERGIHFAGCDSTASQLCMLKPKAKEVVSHAGVPTAEGITLEDGSTPEASWIIDRLGESLVIKPANEGSSVGLYFVQGRKELQAWLEKPRTGEWLIEKRLRGRELTVGLLDGRPLGVVEIAPKGGVYDYAAKYTSGATEYLYPAKLDPETTARVRGYAISAFLACGCRDFARADFILEQNGEAYFLELNTLPGMTQTSLLPKSASCVGLDFVELVRAMVTPALKRAENRRVCV